MSAANNKSTNSIRRFYERHPIISHFVLIIVAGFLLCTLSVYFLDVWTRHGQVSKVPDIKGLTLEQAANVLNDANLGYVITDSIYDDSHAGGTVVDVVPRAGAVVKANREVYVTIVAYSSKMVVIDIPLTDISPKQAENYLSGKGVNSIRLDYVYGDTPGIVVGAKVNGDYITIGSRIPVSSTVVLEVSKGPDIALDEAITAAADSVFAAEDDLTVEPVPDYDE